MVNEYSDGWTTICSIEDPKFKVSFAQMSKILLKLHNKHYRGELKISFWGKDDCVQILRPEGYTRFFPIVTLDDVEQLLQTEEETDD